MQAQPLLWCPLQMLPYFLCPPNLYPLTLSPGPTCLVFGSICPTSFMCCSHKIKQAQLCPLLGWPLMVFLSIFECFAPTSATTCFSAWLSLTSLPLEPWLAAGSKGWQPFVAGLQPQIPYRPGTPAAATDAGATEAGAPETAATKPSTLNRSQGCGHKRWLPQRRVPPTFIFEASKTPPVHTKTSRKQVLPSHPTTLCLPLSAPVGPSPAVDRLTCCRVKGIPLHELLPGGGCQAPGVQVAVVLCPIVHHVVAPAHSIAWNLKILFVMGKGLKLIEGIQGRKEALEQ